jgi:hypothetical protein
LISCAHARTGDLPQPKNRLRIFRSCCSECHRRNVVCRSRSGITFGPSRGVHEPGAVGSRYPSQTAYVFWIACHR